MSDQKVVLRSTREIQKMRRAGIVVWLAHQRVAAMIGLNVTTEAINAQIKQTFIDYDAIPLFLNYPPGSKTPFPAETCVSINEQVVHGIPGKRKLRNGDIISVDTGCKIDGWCGDAAVTHVIGTVPANIQDLIQVTRQSLIAAFEAMKSCQRWSEVATKMQTVARAKKMGIVEELVGHGIGKKLHEPPDVPNYLADHWQGDFQLRPGMVVAVEPMINLGTHRVKTDRDGWTIVTADRKYSAHFEHTIAMTKEGPIRLTGEPTEAELSEIGRPSWLGPADAWFLW